MIFNPVASNASGSGGDDSVFIAEYGTTTNAEIEAAYQAGKAVFCHKVGAFDDIARLSKRMSSADHRFTIIEGALATQYKCFNDAWTATSTTMIDRTGGMMTGALTLSGAPTQDLHAATKKYVDDKAAGCLPLTGGKLNGSVMASDDGQTPGTSLLRNSKLVSSESTPTVNGEINWTYK